MPSARDADEETREDDLGQNFTETIMLAGGGRLQPASRVNNGNVGVKSVPETIAGGRSGGINVGTGLKLLEFRRFCVETLIRRRLLGCILRKLCDKEAAVSRGKSVRHGVTEWNHSG